MDRQASAVEYRSNLRHELSDALAVVRPDQFTLIEMNDLLAILRPAIARARHVGARSAQP